MQCLLGIDRVRPRQMRGSVAHDEGDRLPGANFELADGFHVLAAERRRRAQDHSFRAGDSAYAALREALDPRHDRTVIEAQDEFGLHGYATPQPPDQPDDVRKSMPQTDKIDQLDRTLGGLEHGHEDQRTVKITPLDP